MGLYEGFGEAVQDYAESLALALAVTVILYLSVFVFEAIFVSGYGLSAPFSQFLSVASRASMGMLIDPRSMINIYRWLLFAVSILSGVSSWIFIILKAAKNPWWGLGYAIASAILSPLSLLVFVPLLLISFAGGYASSIILKVLPEVTGMVDPISDALFALFGSVIGEIIGVITALFVRRLLSRYGEEL